MRKMKNTSGQHGDGSGSDLQVRLRNQNRVPGHHLCEDAIAVKETIHRVKILLKRLALVDPLSWFATSHRDQTDLWRNSTRTLTHNSQLTSEHACLFSPICYGQY
jgi:hypothetical protein